MAEEWSIKQREDSKKQESRKNLSAKYEWQNEKRDNLEREGGSAKLLQPELGSLGRLPPRPLFYLPWIKSVSKGLRSQVSYTKAI